MQGYSDLSLAYSASHTLRENEIILIKSHHIKIKYGCGLMNIKIFFYSIYMMMWCHRSQTNITFSYYYKIIIRTLVDIKSIIEI